MGNKNNNLKNSGNSQPNAKKAKINERNKLRKNLNEINITATYKNMLMKYYNNKSLSYNAVMRTAREEAEMRANQRGVKRVRNYIVSQPTAKRVNTNRNKLLRILRGKTLPTATKNGLMKSYDNKTKTVNQIIREANNLSSTYAAGITAQRMGTLRARR